MLLFLTSRFVSSADGCHVVVRSLNVVEFLQMRRKQPILDDDKVERTIITENCFSIFIKEKEKQSPLFPNEIQSQNIDIL